MVPGVAQCVQVRVDFFEKYFTIPAGLQGVVDSFIRDMQVLGEGCGNPGEFEAAFVSTGLSDRFNALIPQCTPKAVELSQQDQQYSQQVAAEMKAERRKGLGKRIAMDVAESAQMEVEQELMSQNTRRMAQEGTLDEYTKVSNAVDDAQRVGGLFRRLFKK